MSKLTEEEIKTNTRWSDFYYNNLKEDINNYELDIYKEDRINSSECKTCYYLKNGISGQAFTKYTCKNCGEEKMYHNTSVPKFCDKCSKEFNICVRCGAELDTK